MREGPSDRGGEAVLFHQKFKAYRNLEVIFFYHYFFFHPVFLAGGGGALLKRKSFGFHHLLLKKKKSCSPSCVSYTNTYPKKKKT